MDSTERIITRIDALGDDVSDIKAEQAAAKQWRINTDKTLNGILIQTKATNGRVNELENWRSSVDGSIKVVYALIVIIIAAITMIAAF